MIHFKELIDKAIENGYTGVNANAKVAQDVILLIISKIEYSKNVTLKGGVLMRNISNDARRATKDIDIDLIRYSIDDIALTKLIQRFDGVEDIKVNIIGKIKELNQQDYKGKRVSLELIDPDGEILQTKIDFGVHTDLSIKQVDYCIDIGIDEKGIIILANSNEQMFAEKLCSLLRHRITTTRYKDIFDLYYLTDYVEKKALKDIINKIIIDNELVKENSFIMIYESLEDILSNEGFIKLVKNSKDNWLEKDVDVVIGKILSYMGQLK